MLQRKELESMTVDELRKVCKENGISYYENRKRITKGRMIDKLMSEVYCDEEIDGEVIEDSVEENDKDGEQNEQPVKTDEQIALEEKERRERKEKYIEQAVVGTIVAFKVPDSPKGKVISAMITRKSTKGRKFMVETQYGAEYKISFDDVIWVRSNERWPKGVYMLFKRNINNNTKKETEEVTKDGEEIG